jgi:hypothetical protein
MSPRRLPVFVLIVGCVGCVACVGCAGGSPSSRLPEVEALRGEIARPERFPVRHGLEIDAAPVK